MALLHTHLLFFSPRNLTIIRSEKASSSSSSSSSSSDSTPPKGKGFGSSSNGSNKKEKQKRERASIIRRSPLEKPPSAFVSEQEQGSMEQRNIESAFILAWLGFGAIILVEGIALAASGFLPEEWDKLFVKYLYPSFTPTVFLFFVGAVAYGVLKYLQNEKITEGK